MGRPTTINNETRKLIAQSYLDGMTVYEIGNKYSVSIGSASRILKEFNIKARNASSEDITGEIFYSLTAIKYVGIGNNGRMWLCKCKCGKEIEVSFMHLKHGQKSCRECFFKTNTKHGMCGTKEYQAWRDMKTRCYGLKASHRSYESYAGRGIVVCDRWLESFENFYEDMGDAPSKRHSLDRFPNNDGNYEPGNCRWALPLQQVNNRRNNIIVDYNGEKRLLKDLADEKGVRYKTVLNRYRNKGYSLEEALIKPIPGKRLLVKKQYKKK